MPTHVGDRCDLAAGTRHGRSRKVCAVASSSVAREGSLAHGTNRRFSRTEMISGIKCACKPIIIRTMLNEHGQKSADAVSAPPDEFPPIRLGQSQVGWFWCRGLVHRHPSQATSEIPLVASSDLSSRPAQFSIAAASGALLRTPIMAPLLCGDPPWKESPTRSGQQVPRDEAAEQSD